MRLYELYDVKTELEEDKFKRVDGHHIDKLSEEEFRKMIREKVMVNHDDLATMIEMAISKIIDIEGQLSAVREGLLSTILDQSMVHGVKLKPEVIESIRAKSDLFEEDSLNEGPESLFSRNNKDKFNRILVALSGVGYGHGYGDCSGDGGGE